MTSDVIKLWEGEETGSYFAVFSFSQIRNGTDNFSTENMLGEGGLALCTRYHMFFNPVCFTYLRAFHKLNENAGSEACVMCLWLYPYLVIAI
jgi:hypothetical protein